ncbi:MAG: hypothetical protein N3A66_08405 [Planctomycetota bacterium]|nr:hypothetical protein [Planctomycetota bacterium]
MRRNLQRRRVVLEIAALLAGLGLATAKAENGAEHMPGTVPWSWSEAEIKKIDALEKKIKQDEKGYWTYSKDNYVIKSAISARFTAEIALYMEIFFKVFPKIFEVPPLGEMLCKLEVFVHKDRGAYLAATGAPPWSGGVHIADFYAGRPLLQVHTFPWRAERSQNREVNFIDNFNRGVLQHEGAHALFQKFACRRKIPVFFNEGCATYFETWDLRVERPTPTERAERLARGFHLLALLRKMKEDPNYKPSLQQCLTMDHMMWGSGEIDLHYALAESFVDFLLSTKEGRQTFRKMVEASYKHTAYESQKVLLEPKEVVALEPKWHEHIQKLVGELEKVKFQRNP